jgi:Uma2 family endonuclease
MKSTATRYQSPDRSPHRRRVSEAEFLDWLTEEKRAEWVNGEIINTAPDNSEHNDITSFLLTIIRMTGQGKAYMEGMQTRLQQPLSRRQPDIVFISSQRLDIVKRTFIDGAPDLAIEVVSPDSRLRDYGDKLRDYEIAGVREYWIVDPLKENLEAYRLERGRYARIPIRQGRVTSAVIKGFYLKAEWLWQHPLPLESDVLREMGMLPK